MAIELSELIELLNKDLGLEYTAMVQYVQHSGVLTGAEYGDIIKELKIQANEELKNAIILVERFDHPDHGNIAAHAKDFTVVEGLLPHCEEVVIGKGLLDQETFLRRMGSVSPDAHVLIEHLPDDLVPAARDGLNAAAARAGIAWDEPPD